MDLLISNFWGYLKLYQVKIPQIIICGLFIELIFAILKKRGYVTYKNSTNMTRTCGLLLAFSISWVINMTILGRTSREEFEVRLLPRGYVTYKNSTNMTRTCGLLLAFSISWVINMTILGRTSREEFEVRLLPFGSYIEALLEGDAEVWLQILMNVVMFVPIGLLLPCCFRKFEKNKRIFLTTLICSSGIELLQGIFKIGMLETDDVLGNVLGAEIGFLIWWVSRKWKKDENR